MEKLGNLAIIPARGGSKRIPNKNIKHFLGKPIIAYSIERAINSGLFDEVMVSTDSAEIKSVSLKYGAKVPFMRSQKQADDFATLADVVDEVHEAYKLAGKSYRRICCILPTAPLLSEITLKNGLKLLEESNFDSVRPIVRFSYPIQRSFKLINSKVEFFYPENLKVRSQDLEPSYHDCGQFYWMDSEIRLRGENKGAIEITSLETQDIDEDIDWKLAEMKYRVLNSL